MYEVGTILKIIDSGTGAMRINKKIAIVVDDLTASSHGLLDNGNCFKVQIGNEVWRVSKTGEYKVLKGHKQENKHNNV